MPSDNHSRKLNTTTAEKTTETEPPWFVRTFRAIFSTDGQSDKILALLRGFGILVLVAIPAFLFTFTGIPDASLRSADPDVARLSWTGGRVIWTVVIALLPLFIVSVGFYAWRRICPLAFFGRMSEWLEWPDKRGTPNAEMRRKRVSGWMAHNYPVVTSSFLITMLIMRLLLINSNPAALGWTFVILCVLATVCSFRYTGKTWCNFFCPVGTIERIYTDTDRPAYRKNAQCLKCTGCKTVPSGGLCPDINQENDYWQEIRNRSRAWAYYSWPGVVFGFYLWYYLHKPYYWHSAGRQPDPAFSSLLPSFPGTDWGYYLSGDWTRQLSPWREWLTPGFGFYSLPPFLAHIPTLAAAPLTILAMALLSFGVFSMAELVWNRILKSVPPANDRAPETVRHSLFVVAGFAGFVLFYQFAGAPTLCHLPFGLYGAFRFSVIMCSTVVLITRLRRTRAKQLQYDQARKWLQRWPLPDVTPPEDLEDAYRVVTEHLRTSDDRVRLYQNTIQGMLAENLLTAKEIGLLDRMANDLGLGEAEKKKVVRQLSSQYPGLFSGTLDESLRLLGYRGELERSISDNRGILPQPGALKSIQSRYRIQPDEHEAVLRELRDPNSSRTEYLRKEVEELKSLREDVELLGVETSPAIRFLHHELTVRLGDQREHILEVANLYGAAGELTGLSEALRRGDPAAMTQAVDWIDRHLPDTISSHVAGAIQAPSAVAAAAGGRTNDAMLANTLLRWTVDSDVVVRATSVYALSMVKELDPETRAMVAERATTQLNDAEPLLREAAVAAIAPHLTVTQWQSALSDPIRSVRRSAILRVPVPVPQELLSLVNRAREDGDVLVRSRAALLIDDPDRAESARDTRQSLTVLEKMFAVRSLRLLSHIPSDALRQLAEHADERIFRQCEDLCVQGEASDDVFLIIEGETEAVRISNGIETRLGLNHPGETVGEMGILDPAPRMATVRALTPIVRVLTVHGTDFRALLARDATASIGIIRLLIQRQRDMSK